MSIDYILLTTLKHLHMVPTAKLSYFITLKIALAIPTAMTNTVSDKEQIKQDYSSSKDPPQHHTIPPSLKHDMAQ
jgi:hypothetical protein